MGSTQSGHHATMVSITLWTFCAYCMCPTALCVVALMLSGVGFLERLGVKFCGISIGIGRRQINLMLFFITLAALGLAKSLSGISYASHMRAESSLHTDQDDRFKMQLFRNQRNLWITGSNLVLWIIAWRLQSILKRPNSSGIASGSEGDDDKAKNK